MSTRLTLPATARLLAPILLSVAAAIAAGCAGTAAGGGEVDMTAEACDGAGCGGGCASDKDCGAPKGRCDVQSGRCVGCLFSADCPNGAVCDPGTHACVPGCSPMQGCGDAGVCEADAGACVECLVDANCRDPKLPRCDAAPGKHRCTPCLPDNDNCGFASYCALSAGDYSCQPGCKDEADCAGDGGVGGNTHCDLKLHQCVRCGSDSDCPLGRLCNNGACVEGCNQNHGCAAPATCCGGACVDVMSSAEHCGACGMACPGGWACCGGNCANPVSDAMNCGACGTICTVANGTPKCLQRVCGIGGCNPGWADCDGSYLDGCEIHTDVNVSNCGGCGNACALAHAQPRCLSGACQIDTCLFPFEDCNVQPGDGCEVNTRSTDLSNCGACGQKCMLANATPKCDAGACAVASCDQGFANCDGQAQNGCEVNTQTTNLHCGGCGMQCTTPHATPQCVLGNCRIGLCDPGWFDCDLDPKNGCEINLANDAKNCGACGKTCASTNGIASCSNATCQIACNPGFGNCDLDPTNGCETNLFVDPNNCGVCATQCSGSNVAQRTCAAPGVCNGNCVGGFADCNNDKQSDGCETNTSSDPKNCGGCGAACALANATAACMGGGCKVAACNAGFGDCDNIAQNGCETNLSNTATNCGACGNACNLAHATPGCANNACTIVSCNPGWGNCDNTAQNGCEADLANSPMDCGVCGNTCNLPHATPKCSVGVCQVASCDAGWGNCDNNPANGCEVDLTITAQHCGVCGNVCLLANASSGCVGGACAVTACNGGWGNCDGMAPNGCETQVNTVANCGACGNTCNLANATPVCANGACAISSCNAGYADCNKQAADGCEINLKNDVNNCNACGVQCMFTNAAAQCTNGACQIGACNPAFGNCDGNPANGCEANFNTSNAHCGGCNIACALQNATAQCVNGGCGLVGCNGGWGNCDNNPANGCETNLTNSGNNCGACGNVCPGGQICTNSVCVPAIVAANCNIVTTMNVWGSTSCKGVDLRSWTSSTLHYIGCNGDGCSNTSFYCTYDANTQTLQFGSTGTTRAMVNPNNANGDNMPNTYGGCCTGPLGLCNGPDMNNNGFPFNNAASLCWALGYKNGTLVRGGLGNVCPEADVRDNAGQQWNSDWVASDGYGAEWRCQGFR